MTAYKFTPLTSIYAPAGDAFNEVSTGNDSLTVDQGAFLLARGAGGDGAVLHGLGAWNVTVNGIIYSVADTGLLLLNTGKSSVTVGTEGEIFGEFLGLSSFTSTTIKNAGRITGGTNAIMLNHIGTSTITNSGVVAGNIKVNDEQHQALITNSGSIEGDITFVSDGNRLTNTGEIEGSLAFSHGNNSYMATGAGVVSDITAGNGDDTVSSASFTGQISLGGGKNRITLSASGFASKITTGAGDDTVSSAGTVQGPIELGDGNNSFTNSGTVNGNVTSINGTTAKFTNSGTINGAVGFSTATTTIKNSGKIDGSVNGATLVDTFSNSGTITGTVWLNDGNDIVTNSGSIGGTLDLGAGNDKVTNTGKIDATVDLGDGDDSYTGGSFHDRVADTKGAEKISLGGGGDSYIAAGVTSSGGIDTIDGGAGRDIYTASDATGDLRINLDAALHDIKIIGAPSLPVAAKSAIGIGVGADLIANFEDAFGGYGNDIIFGSSAENALYGSGGADYLFGFGGNDILDGGNDNDNLVGGLGADRLIGGNGVDQFIFIATNESGNTKATRDVIMDFQDGIDFINVSLIDAYTKNGAIDDAFVYINGDSSVTPSAVFTKVLGQGQLRSYWTADGHIIEGDVNADGKADFSIAVDDPTHTITFTQTDFIVN